MRDENTQPKSCHLQTREPWPEPDHTDTRSWLPASKIVRKEFLCLRYTWSMVFCYGSLRRLTLTLYHTRDLWKRKQRTGTLVSASLFRFPIMYVLSCLSLPSPSEVLKIFLPDLCILRKSTLTLYHFKGESINLTQICQVSSLW